MKFLNIIQSALLVAVTLNSSNALAKKLVVKSYDELLAQLSEWGFNGAISVTKNGVDVFNDASGVRNADKGSRLEKNDRFPIGSVSKTFTSVAILKLKEQGKLSLEDTLQKYFPEIKWASQVTIRQLLSHTAGIFNYTDTENFFEWCEKNPNADFQDLLSLFASKDLEFQPGSKHSYSNSGYVLLGRVIEIESGLSYSDFLEKEIFAPLEMKDSFYDPKYQAGNGPAPHTFEDAISPKLAQEYSLAWAFAAGGIVSTVHDLGLFNTAIDNATILTTESIREMETVVLDDYALGVMLSNFEGKKIVWHTGGLPYYLAYNIRIPSEKISIAVLTNVFDTKLRNILAHAAMDIAVLGEATLDYTRPITLPEDRMKAYPGVFHCQEIGMDAVVVLEGGKLYVTPSGQPKLRLLPTSDTTFEIRGVANLAFKEDGSSFELLQNGKTFKFLRKD